ncbi:MAG: Rha family transcriptional regulator, partial [Chlorobium sp.]|nr:Rha family transcriptional regulator [Chlorobium sp.]
MKELIVAGQSKTMTSREIAELAEKEHFHVMRDIKSLIDSGAIGATSFGLSSYKSEQNKDLPMYLLDFRATMTLVTGYDARRRALVINRWVDLENGRATPAYLQAQPKPRTMTQKYREAASIVSASMSIGKLLGTALPMAKAIAVESARRETGLDFIKMLPSSDMTETPVG